MTQYLKEETYFSNQDIAEWMNIKRKTWGRQ